MLSARIVGIVVDYQSKAEPRTRLSKLAVAAFVLSLLTSPFVLRLLPHDVITGAIRTARIGALVLAVPAVLSTAVSWTALHRLHSNGRFLTGAPLAVIAVMINALTILLYVSVTLVVIGTGG
jgi:hypothetical protein